MGADPAVRVSVPEGWAEMAGGVLLDLLGPFQEFDEGGLHHMIFYPFRHGAGFVEDERILAELPDDALLREATEIERVLVPTGWEEGWKDHFKPITVGRLYIRPPWEPPPPRPTREAGAAARSASAAGSAATGGLRAAAGTESRSTEAAALLDIVLTPGLAFGTGLHPTTRGVMTLLQDEAPCGPVVDVGTGSGILAISAGKLGFGPILAFDNDPLAVTAARTNAQENGVDVRAEHADLGEVPSAWFDDATILANLTLEPVLALISQLVRGGAVFRRLLVSGILSGEQEAIVVAEAARSGLSVERPLYETEWVSMDLRLRA